MERMNCKMKKILTICFTLLMVLSLSISAIAAPGSFVTSPSGNPTPELVEGKIDGKEDWDCGAKIVITSYADRDKLTETAKNIIEYAYSDVAMSVDLTELNDDLAKVAADKKIDGRLLAVSDLFDISVEGCVVHGHTTFECIIEADTLGRFVGLLNMPEKGTWQLISNAQVINDGKQLKFSVDSLNGPFAIVVESDGNTPQTGDNSKIYIYAIVLAVSALALVVIIIAKKKQKKQ